MHSLLKRQIRKFLPDEFQDHPGLQAMLDSIDKSYTDFDDKLSMIQRATQLSSTELYEANRRLNRETESQRKILQALSEAVALMEQKSEQQLNGEAVFDPQKLVEDIEKQTQKIVEINAEKDVLMKSLEDQNTSLNNYAHMVSHDLKSPIRNVYSLVTWVFEDHKTQLGEGGEGNFDLIFQNLKKMDSLIDGILRHATIDSLEDEIREVDLNKLIQEIQNTVFIPENVKLLIDDELPVLNTSKYRIEQLFKNLITNAVSATEHKEDGTIVIDAQQDKNKWLFSISDNGKGIPAQHQEGIFDMFKKLENDANATGIGLALVKKIVNYYKGDIWLSSEEGEGTTFFFTIQTKL